MNKQPEKIQVKETSKIYDDTFEGHLESIIYTLQRFQDEMWEGIEVESIGYDGAVEYYLYKHRPETDEEYDKRMKLLEKEKEQKLKQKEKRRIQYEMLKKEFEDT